MYEAKRGPEALNKTGVCRILVSNTAAQESGSMCDAVSLSEKSGWICWCARHVVVGALGRQSALHCDGTVSCGVLSRIWTVRILLQLTPVEGRLNRIAHPPRRAPHCGFQALTSTSLVCAQELLFPRMPYDFVLDLRSLRSFFERTTPLQHRPRP